MMLVEIIWIVVIVKIAGLKTVGSLQYRGGAVEFFFKIIKVNLCNNSYTFV
jgi:hypothetical protein